MSDCELDRYQQKALRTWNLDEPQRLRKINAMLGIVGEGGELADAIKKWAFHGHALPDDDAIKELGDILWYVAVMAHEFGVSLSEVADRNIAKLEERYPDGFSEENSRLRMDVTIDGVRHGEKGESGVIVLDLKGEDRPFEPHSWTTPSKLAMKAPSENGNGAIYRDFS